MIKVSELKGFKSLRALNAFHALMLGLKMLPAYQYESYEEFFGRVEKMTPDQQKVLITEAVLFVELQPDEVEALVSFCKDPNGVSYQAANVLDLNPAQLVDIIVAVSLKVLEIKIDFVTEDEKKNSLTSQ